MPASSRTAVRLAGATLAVNVFVVLWGAWVRASGSGAGCGNHWPTCNGAIIPASPGAHTLIEFTHRATTAVALVLVVALLLATFSTLRAGHWARRAAAVTLILLGVEAGIGAGLVKFDLVTGNATVTRAVVLGLHLVNTQLLLSAIVLTGWWAAGHAPIAHARWRDHGGWFVMALAALALVGMAGVIASLGDTLFPATSLVNGLAQDHSPVTSWLVHVRVWHPIIALVTGCGVMVLAVAATRWRPDPAVQHASQAVIAAVVAQWLIGAMSLVLLAPIALQLLHLLVADLLWLSVVWLGAATLAGQCARTVLARSEAASASNTVPAPSSR